MILLQHYLLISAALFSLGVFGVLTRRNAINVLMGVELILNSANINLVAFSRYSSSGIDGQMFAIFVILAILADARPGSNGSNAGCPVRSNLERKLDHQL